MQEGWNTQRRLGRALEAGAYVMLGSVGAAGAMLHRAVLTGEKTSARRRRGSIRQGVDDGHTMVIRSAIGQKAARVGAGTGR
ncbi:hypothetical protein NDU88_003067 [Pleurodeles waltl]|uniref:Uncharacterized protein n=1 Tax=Pleurodeles waltl TaxID=8319 RepID=A0AAV7MTI0_PLEWA|nr:hypothetical protein NDU88_003067 [Pleurodeles waltl]